MSIRFSNEEFHQIKNILLIYQWGLKSFMTKLDIINEDFKNFHPNNPIEHIKSRIKAPESIAEKLHKMELEITADNARRYIRDIVGIRIICAFARDIYYLVDVLKAVPEVNVISEKDYIDIPKISGYRSYHIILEIPVYYSGRTENIPVEIQIRTAAMDFWATLEHKVKYKYDGHIPPHLSDELAVCADSIAELDNRMFQIHDIISLINQ